MKAQPRIRAIKNQLRQFTLPFIIFILFWVLGIILIAVFEPDKNFWHILTISICIEESVTEIGFFAFYQFLWPLLFEILILSFILSTIQDIYGYNPIMSSRKLASNRSRHSVVLGYNHLGERIVEYLRANKQPFSIVEIDYEKVDNLISFNQPVVVGDYTDPSIIALAGIARCREVFCVTNDLRRGLIAAERVREVNKDCHLYMRVFDIHFREYLTNEPWNAFTFSTSDWTMESVKIWGEKIRKNDKIVVLGYDNIVRRIVDYYGEKLQATVYVLDEGLDDDTYLYLPNVKTVTEHVRFIETLKAHVDLTEVTQVYICWNTEELFSDAILLTLALKKQYPKIALFVRMFDEELAEIAKTLDATTFSTSAYAFKMLQKEVKEISGIHPNKELKKKK
ncbi:MAG: hypothetical protein FK734_09385 [Asgard group archaeon]|nr:hypothetical protein [Asgard group archaeon]